MNHIICKGSILRDGVHVSLQIDMQRSIGMHMEYT